MIDMTKTYRTVCGFPVRIYATDAGGKYSVHGAYRPDDDWIAMSWSSHAGYAMQDGELLSLVEVKPRIQQEVWLNVYEHVTGGSYATKELADINSSHARIACVKLTIDCEHGEGLE